MRRYTGKELGSRQYMIGGNTTAQLNRARIEIQQLRQRVSTLSAELKRLTTPALVKR